MPRKKPVVPQSAAAAPAPPATETIDDALREAQDRIVELGHRVEMAEAETQRSIDACTREQNRAQEEVDGLQRQIAALQATPTMASDTASPWLAPPTKWLVRHVGDDAALEGLLNILAHDGWNIHQVFRPRASSYHVLAWRVEV